MGKKGKKGRAAKISEEDRLRFLQHLADIEAENKRRKEELITLYLKNKLKCEDGFLRINIAKINQEWRQILRKIKCDELTVEINSQCQLIEKSVDKKNAIIERLITYLNQGEEQYSRNFQAYSENLDRIIYIYKNQLNGITLWFETHKQALIVQFRKDVAMKDTRMQQQTDQLRSLIAVEHTKQEQWIVRNHDKFVDGKNDVFNESELKTEQLATKKQAEIEIINAELSRVLRDHLTKSESKRREYESLWRADQDDAKIACKYKRIIQKQTELFTKLKNLYENTMSERSEQIQSLVAKKEILLKQQLVMEMEHNRREVEEREAIKILVSNSCRCIDRLGSTAKLATQVTQHFELIRHLDGDTWWKTDGSHRNKLAAQFQVIYEDIKQLEAQNSTLEKERHALVNQLRDQFTNLTFEGSTRTAQIATRLLPASGVYVNKLQPPKQGCELEKVMSTM